MHESTWRNHLIVHCDNCKLPMGYHKDNKAVVCNTCKGSETIKAVRFKTNNLTSDT